ncbi:hypothetical protein BpHYR1_032025 [Brachionus plicatilis]|uniref:Uncharacterized protein n=1 Tax=Brachionus plicatilis TaxID=10195 RepID=A0A3M7T1K2_BRAPC|nr:hypothetical protein BpHYR1_032025 [Brachionus plicatilis]
MLWNMLTEWFVSNSSVSFPFHHFPFIMIFLCPFGMRAKWTRFYTCGPDNMHRFLSLVFYINWARTVFNINVSFFDGRMCGWNSPRSL